MRSGSASVPWARPPLGEDRSVARMACFGLILMGIVGLKLLTLRSDTGA